LPAISHVFTILFVAETLGEDEDRLHELSINMFPEDGCQRVDAELITTCVHRIEVRRTEIAVALLSEDHASNGDTTRPSLPCRGARRRTDVIWARCLMGRAKRMASSSNATSADMGVKRHDRYRNLSAKTGIKR
jgi:hypothetical protein